MRGFTNSHLNYETTSGSPQSLYELRNHNMNEMAQSTLDRLWNRLVNRYEQDKESDCCGRNVEEVQSDSTDAEAESCCE